MENDSGFFFERNKMNSENKIFTFAGPYRFLSNFYPAPFVWDDILWPTSEHAYQAAKTLDKKLVLKSASFHGPVKLNVRGNV